MRHRRVVVTGLGAVTPLGVGVKRSWRRLLDGKCGVVNLLSRGSEFAKLPSQVAAVVPLGSKAEGGWDPSEWLTKDDERKMAKFSQFAFAAAQEALEDSRWQPSTETERERTGVYIGSGIGSLDDAVDMALGWKAGGYRKVSPLFVPRLLINLAAGHISMKFGFKGPNHAASTACTTGAHALGDAARMIQFGDADVMLAGGAESCIHPLAIAGFARARSLATSFNDTPEKASRPFDLEREGFVIGEGAGVVVLEEAEHARRRNAPIYAELLGYGLSSDAHHITQPHPDGAGPYLSMRNALRNAEVDPGSVDYVNAHATSTPLGDAAENRAVQRLLRSSVNPRPPSSINISSTKGAMGHLLGAAGAVEAILTILAVHNNILPPTLNLDKPGNPPKDGLVPGAEEYACNYVQHTPQDHKVNVAVTNSFGFGGTSASIAFGKFSDNKGK